MLLGSLMIGVCDWWSTESRSFARLEELWFSRWLGLLQHLFGTCWWALLRSKLGPLKRLGLPPRTKSEGCFLSRD